ncbi:unnamed protein product [Trichobilharzia regenti]|nr:unnamed protein product [Trichobilharzia regenti]
MILNVMMMKPLPQKLVDVQLKNLNLLMEMLLTINNCHYVLVILIQLLKKLV